MAEGYYIKLFLENMFSFVKKYSILLIIFTTAFASAYKTLSFYFWHDDFSIVYVPRSGDCVYPWPMEAYCTILIF